MKYAWRPQNTLYLTLQEALQLGDGAAVQNGNLRQFECNLVRKWATYADGRISYDISAFDERTERIEDAQIKLTPIDKAAYHVEIGTFAEIEDADEPLASGTVGYNVIVSGGEVFEETVAATLEEAVSFMASYNPEPNLWEPSWQMTNSLCVAKWPHEPLQIEFHSNDTAQKENLAALVE